MRILVVATKSPWPAHDGGRLVLWLTLQALAAQGHVLRLIAPTPAPPDTATLARLASICEPLLVPSTPRAWPAALLRAGYHGQALSLARHDHAAVAAAVAASLADWHPDLVHAEQLQAMANCAPALAAGLPVLLRMQNVESALWQQVSTAGLLARPLRWEARRLRRDEARHLREAAQVVTLTEPDAAALRTLAPDRAAAIHALAPAFPAELPAGPAVGTDTPVALAGSAGWWPNRQGLDWFLREVKPQLPAAATPYLHLFGAGTAPGLVTHAAPDDAAVAFPAGAIAAVPLLTGSGIRMRILEAWARGLPVVATRVAASGLDVVSERELLLADTPAEFAAALIRLRGDAALRAALAAAGRAYLQRRHAPEVCAAALGTAYVRACAAPA